MQNFRKIAKLTCREICEPQNREINVSRKFHVIRYILENKKRNNITQYYEGPNIKSHRTKTIAK